MLKTFRYWLANLRGREHDDPLVQFPRWLKTCFRDRRPDQDIGPGYLQRWWILPRNPIANIYLHRVWRDDDDRALHDHPWINLSIILRGAYREVMPDFGAHATPYVSIAALPTRGVLRRAGAMKFRRPSDAHRLEVVDGPVWSLFITGPTVRAWGFHCPKGWRHWREFTDPHDPMKVGRGCN